MIIKSTPNLPVYENINIYFISHVCVYMNFSIFFHRARLRLRSHSYLLGDKRHPEFKSILAVGKNDVVSSCGNSLANIPYRRESARAHKYEITRIIISYVRAVKSILEKWIIIMLKTRYFDEMIVFIAFASV